MEISQEMTTSRRNNKSKRNRRERNGKLPPPTPVQTLFDACKEVLDHDGFDFIPKSADVERICSIMDGIKPVDVGVSADMAIFRAKKSGTFAPIAYIHLYHCDEFNIGIFCLAPGGMIPLHNHPRMTVFSKILFGTMHIKSYDWATADVPSKNALDETTTRLAKLKINDEFSAPCNTSVLYPNDGGNMHCFTAITPCAVLDVLTPPYSDPAGRHCTYYNEFPLDQTLVEGVKVPESEKEDYVWLEEKEQPEELIFIGARYNGPKIISKT